MINKYSSRVTGSVGDWPSAVNNTLIARSDTPAWNAPNVAVAPKSVGERVSSV
mgnify:CR=1 FL=1